MLTEYPSDKDRIIVEQRHQISSLADESERLRRERNELLTVIRELGTGSASGSALAMQLSSLECPQKESEFYPYSCNNNKILTRPTSTIPVPHSSTRTSRKSAHLPDADLHTQHPAFSIPPSRSDGR